jgi:hypothetical protein
LDCFNWLGDFIRIVPHAVFEHESAHDLTLVSDAKVMPAWLAGIQTRRMRPEISMSIWFQHSLLE